MASQASRAESVAREGVSHSVVPVHSPEAMLADRCMIATGIHWAAAVRAK